MLCRDSETTLRYIFASGDCGLQFITLMEYQVMIVNTLV